MLEWVGWLAPRRGRFISGKDPVSIVQEAWWASESVLTSMEDLSPTGFRSTDRPARNESLYRLRYSGRPCFEVLSRNLLEMVAGKSNTCPPTLTKEAVAKLFTYVLICWSHTRIESVLFTVVPSPWRWQLLVAMLRRKLLCDVTVVFLIINLKLDWKQESMVVQVRNALSRQVRN